MRRISLYITFLFSFFLLLCVADASCNNDELLKYKNEASQVKVIYEVKTETIKGDFGENDGGTKFSEIDQDYFNIIISNITENINVILHNKSNNSDQVFTYQNSDNGTVTFRWNDVSNITNFDVNIVASNKTECSSEKLLTNYFTTPKFNIYSDYAACKNNPDESICAKYVTNDVSYESFTKLAEKEEKKIIKELDKEESSKNSKKSFSDKKGFIIFGIIALVLVAGIIAALAIIRKQRGKF